MKTIWTAILMAALLVSAPALAEYPDDCLGLNEPSGSDCAGISYEGCCDDMGRVTWCDGDQLYCIDCAGGGNPSCGWQGEFYDCGTDGAADPSGTNPLECVSCDPPCADGEICKNGACEVCTPDCGGKQCGADGCGGTCGECAGVCDAGLCHAGPGCEVVDGPNCGGCACEACVCELDSFCCESAWDEICVGECIADCGGCATIESCGDGTCDGIETCSNCPADCGCGDDGVCVGGQCCTPWCGGKNCGDDGCGGTCGECAEGESCLSGVCFAPVEGPGCVATEVAGCEGCDCEACACEMDSYCCETKWDAICVSECQACGSCIPEAECGNSLCEPAEDCGTCAGDCTCAPNWVCEEGVCVDPGGCVPACDGKDCGADGCGGSCGDCAEGFACDVDGMCVEDICEADCTDKLCGDDGCGGSCGDCADGEVCSDAGVCGAPVLSCEGICGDPADGCYCDEACFENGDCCVDVCDFCGDLEGCGACEPDCDGKECGDDGCEGSCGVCDAGECTEGVCVVVAECGNGTVEGDETCEADGDCGDNEICPDCACVAGCTPSCDGMECGDDGCGGSCGACAEGLICGDSGLCGEAPVEGDVVSESDVGGEEPTSGGGSSSCSTTGGGNGSALLLVLMALLAMAGIRRQEA